MGMANMLVFSKYAKLWVWTGAITQVRLPRLLVTK